MQISYLNPLKSRPTKQTEHINTTQVERAFSQIADEGFQIPTVRETCKPLKQWATTKVST